MRRHGRRRIDVWSILGDLIELVLDIVFELLD